MNRRQVLKTGAAAAAASSVALPQGTKASKQASNKLDATWEPAVLSPEQNQTVIALIDQIIPATDTPGATAANVNRYIDLFLAETPAERDRFLNGLRWFEEYAAKQTGLAFAKLEPAKQVAILEKLDTGAD